MLMLQEQMLLEQIPLSLRKQMQNEPARMTCRPTDFPTDKINAIVKEMSAFDFSRTSEIPVEMLQTLFIWGFCRDPVAPGILYLKTDYYCITVVLPTETEDGFLHVPSYYYLVSNFTSSAITVTLGEGDDATTICFPCLEAAFQIIKAIHANDMDAILKIFHAETPGKCKEEGGKIVFAARDLATWNIGSPDVMEALLEAKILQNANVRSFFESIKSLADVFGIPLKNIKYPEANVKGGKWGNGLDVSRTLEAILAGTPYPEESLFEKCLGYALMLTVYKESTKKQKLSPPEQRAASETLDVMCDDSFVLERTGSDTVAPTEDKEDGEVTPGAVPIHEGPLNPPGPHDADAASPEP